MPTTTHLLKLKPCKPSVVSNMIPYSQLLIRYNFQLRMLAKYIKVQFKQELQDIGGILGVSIEDVEVVCEHYTSRVLLLRTLGKSYYLKMFDDMSKPNHIRAFNNEVKQLRLLQHNPHIPVPVLRQVRRSYIITEAVDGELADNLEDYKGELQNIIHSMKEITSTSGEYLDIEMNPSSCLFDSVNQVCANYSWYPKSDSLEFELSHNDLHKENIIVKNGKVQAILDWGLSGFYPKNYELCKYNYLKDQYQEAYNIMLFR